MPEPVSAGEPRVGQLAVVEALGRLEPGVAVDARDARQQHAVAPAMAAAIAARGHADPRRSGRARSLGHVRVEVGRLANDRIAQAVATKIGGHQHGQCRQGPALARGRLLDERGGGGDQRRPGPHQRPRCHELGPGQRPDDRHGDARQDDEVEGSPGALLVLVVAANSRAVRQQRERNGRQHGGDELDQHDRPAGKAKAIHQGQQRLDAIHPAVLARGQKQGHGSADGQRANDRSDRVGR